MRAVLVVLALAACSRTGAGERVGPDGGEDVSAPPGVDAGDAGVCEPEQERCDGADNDCNGQIDDALAPEACETGGFRFCVGGALSACPRPCAVCRPGATRVCFPSFCSRWGHQTCEVDGLGWGPCVERPAPVECQGEDDTWDAADDSPEAQECCMARGECCQDHWDLDGDGNAGESLGACDDVTCD
jgi:hypothetical protein